MNDPKRYFLKISRTISGLRCDTFEDKDGMYVDYEDYARLKAEVERLTKAGEMSGNNLKRCNCQECEDARKELHARIALKKGGAK